MMKLQINGFDIEINTSDTEMSIKVIDANGQELAHNTFTQSLETSDDLQDVDIPAVEETDTDTDTDTEELAELEETDTNTNTAELEDTDTEEDTDLTDIDDLEDLEESVVLDFEQYKKLLENKKNK